MSGYHSIKQAVEDVSERLQEAEVYFGHGTDNAWDEAVALVFHVLHIPFDAEESTLDRPVTAEEAAAIHDVLTQRIRTRKPLPYLTHEAYFVGLPFYVDERVLIPRSPIAELIEQQFYPWIEANKVHRILDLCTGSACIAIACAYAFPEAQVDAVDICEDALAVAQRNVEKHHMQDRVRLIQSDLFEQLSEDQPYDIIVSNPPYVSDAEMETLPEEYAHEPQLALQADQEGLAIVERMLRAAPKYLSDHGVLVVEVGNSQQALEARFPNMPFTWLEFERGGEGVFLLDKYGSMTFPDVEDSSHE